MGKKMKLCTINQTIKEINELVLDMSSEWGWFHFAFSLIQEGIAILEGSFDLSAIYRTFDKIEIEFSNAIYIKTVLYEWSLHEEKPLIELVQQDESLKELGAFDDIKSGKFYAFNINTDVNESILVVADGIKYMF